MTLVRSGHSWRRLPALQPAKRRVQQFQRAYWKYFRPLYCETIPLPPAQRVLVVAPHIDDDVIGCGGALRQHVLAGAAVTSVYLRDGGAEREEEARQAAGIVGIRDLTFLRWGPPPTHGWIRRTRPGRKGDLPVNETTVSGLGEVLERVRPEIVYVPFFLDAHPEHATAARVLAEAAMRGAPVGHCFLYEVWTPLVPNVLVDITGEAEIKRRAIDAHRSQVETIDMGTGILGLNAYRGAMNRIRGYAEAFLRVGPCELRAMTRHVDGRAHA
jgi:LmbE family N-acetylglucosaminyl deacetylase